MTTAKSFIRKPQIAGNSLSVTIARDIVKELNLNAGQIFEESVTENGEILLRVRRIV